MFYCTKCGSLNHKAMDCSLPDGTVWVPPPSELERFKALTQPTVKAEPTSAVKLDPARWVGGPTICTKENLCAFLTPAALAEFCVRTGSTVVKKWDCGWCGCIHADFKAHAPAGTTSGTERENNLPKHFRPFIRHSTRQMTARIADETRRNTALPQQRPDTTGEPKKIIDKPRLPAATSKPQKRNADDLF